MVDDDSRVKKQEMSRLGANPDFISNLPDNVIDLILVRLPIRDAVRTSVLSTNWRYTWTTITQLVFHDELVLPSPYDDKDKLINFINLVFQFHSGFIHKFELSTRCLPISSTIDAWIHFLSRKNIKQLVLMFRFPSGQRYKLPSCFFSSQQITTLELQLCVIEPPPTFTGFGNLKSLCLLNTTFDSGGFQCLILKCSVLERLTLDYVFGLENFNICSPNLKYFYLFGPSRDICLKNTPLLSDVSIQTSNIDVAKVLSSLPNLRKLTLGLLRRVRKIPEKLPFTCHHLNNLTLKLNFEYVNHICVTLCLLNSSPNLRELNITSGYIYTESRHDIENFWEEQTLIDWNMSRLQIVKITNIEGLKSELEFIKLLLAKSPMLQMLSIRSSKQDILNRAGLKLLKELLIFPRASPKAKIQFLERKA